MNKSWNVGNAKFKKLKLIYRNLKLSTLIKLASFLCEVTCVDLDELVIANFLGFERPEIMDVVNRIMSVHSGKFEPG